ncbi:MULTISPECIES: ASCH domain-containing protein [Enterobacterales]|uniref:ASCH domain-containing protein n=1 Tax=Enterobacterales TaxID=91347 RepID=UPI00084800C4|nr:MULTISPECIES: ASCH domain-containing protein [Enterobacterales]WOO51046.1 ASCH domain-containing protein [Hafnia alvei]MCK9782016.1 ASCH domain-containing protein [Proteus columbae]ODQ06590.1 ASCH domain-containing protein [Shigella sp. FC130]OEI94210.1 ASCH domain-containing protein [Shigella sp. FC1655]OEJ09127.1 ASCH domain-containing protein [Shigella sp. FC1967]
MLAKLKKKYPTAISWSFGDNAQLADELAMLVIDGKKTATCSSLSGFFSDSVIPVIGGFNIILNSKNEPVCVIRTRSLQLIRFNEVTEELAKREGEGDLSLSYWQEGHKAFFNREGTFSEDMELVFEEFELIEVCKRH